MIDGQLCWLFLGCGRLPSFEIPGAALLRPLEYSYICAAFRCSDVDSPFSEELSRQARCSLAYVQHYVLVLMSYIARL